MGNTKGRDNKMYFISDGYNLDESNDNRFGSLLTLKGVMQTQSSMSSLAVPALPSVRSQTIQHTSVKKGSAPSVISGLPAEMELNQRMLLSALKLS